MIIYKHKEKCCSLTCDCHLAVLTDAEKLALYKLDQKYRAPEAMFSVSSWPLPPKYYLELFDIIPPQVRNWKSKEELLTHIATEHWEEVCKESDIYNNHRVLVTKQENDEQRKK